MNASWMVASVLTSSLLAIAAMAWERVVALRRGVPLRWAWVAAMLVATGFPVVWLLPTTVSARTRPWTSTADSTVLRAPVAPGATSRRLPEAPTGPGGIDATQSRLRAYLSIPPIPTRVERYVRTAWILLSLGLLAALAWSSVRLRRDRRTWRSAALHNAPVLISDGFGPAIVGVLRPTIVIPPWVLGLEEAAQQTILAHEEEHRRAGDPRLLLAGLGLLVLMPWNIGLWVMWRRLGRAIELDCDERVLARGVRDADYANVLLGAWQRAHAEAPWVPSPAFAEHASGLGRRVEHLMRPVPRRWLMQAVTGSLVTAVFVGAVLLVPAPQLAQGTGTVASGKGAESLLETPPLILVDGVKRKDVNSGRAVRDLQRELQARGERVALMQSVDSVHAVRLYGKDGTHGALALWSATYMVRGGAVLPDSVVRGAPIPRADEALPVSDMVGRVYANLFRDITLSPASEAKARALIAQDQNAQLALDGPYLAIWPQRIELVSRRNEALRQLVTSPSDRARFDGRAARTMPDRLLSVEGVARNVAINYFYSLQVSQAEIERSLKVIAASLIAERDLYDRAPKDVAGRRAILAKRDADVRAALSSDATRAAFDKRQASLRAIKE